MILAFENTTWAKTVQNVREMSDLDPRMWDIIKTIGELFKPYRHTLVITAARYEGGSGVHSTYPLRALDIRSKFLPRDVCRRIEDHMNRKYVRADGKPTCMWHDAGSGLHFHLQLPYEHEYLQDI